MSTTGAQPEVAPSAERPSGKRLLLAVCCAAQFLVILDLSIVSIALPSIQTDLRISAADLQWIVNAYAILFAGFLMLAGRATDIFGRRRTFVAGLSLFTLASLGCGLAPDDLTLIIARGLQGLAGAGMAAASLAIITSSFAAGPERAKAIGLWGAMNGLGGATGLLLGGVLTDLLSWRWVFLINVPIAIVVVAMTYRVVSGQRGAGKQGFDLPGALLLTLGLLILTYGGVEAGSEGFTAPEALIPAAIGTALLMLFPLVERRVKAPLVPPGSFGPQLRMINLIVLLFSAALFPMWFVGSLYLQQVLALSPLETGVAFLPMALVIFACASQAGKLVSRAGVKPVLGGGLTMMGTGLLLFGLISESGSAIQYVVLPGVITAMGIGFSIVPSTIAATMTAGPQQAGLASGLVNSARQIGGGLGLAILLAIATQFTAVQIGDGQPVEAALTDGFRVAYLVAAGLALSAAVLTFLVLPGAPDPALARGSRRVLLGAAGVVAVFAAVALGVPDSKAPALGAFTTEGTLSFVSEPDLHPPQLETIIAPDKPLDGYIMAANFYDTTDPPIKGQSGPMILGDDLEPVWFKPVPEKFVAANLEVQRYQGRDVLTYWQGDISPTGEVAEGEFIILDENYKQIAKIKGQDGWVLTLHELKIRGDEAWITVNKNTRRDLSDDGGVSNGVFVDSGVQRYDIASGKLLSTWKASDQVALAESETQPPPNGFPWDALHINSIDVSDDGAKMVVSMRNTWAGYQVDAASGKIDWRLGGKRSDFELPRDARFQWQHDIDLRDGNRLSMFDNQCCEITGAGDYLPSDAPSRALTLKLDLDAKTAVVDKELSHGPGFAAQYMGNAQDLGDGRSFVGWGELPFFSVFDAKGELVFDAALPNPNMSYRAYLQDWKGTPEQAPKCVADGGEVAVSWNGATEVAAWRAEGAAEKVARDGFETMVPAPAGAKLEALDAKGEVLATCQPAQP